jgi:molybdate transport system substrate-binding protein
MHRTSCRPALTLPAAILFLGLGVSAPAAPPAVPGPRDLVVFAASSLSNVFDEISRLLESHNPGLTVTCNYAGSSTLAAQLQAGEVADLFASANTKQMELLVDAGLTARGGPVTFAANRLVVITPAKNPAGVRSCEDLGKLRLALVLAAPAVPVRDYADQMAARVAAQPAYGEGFLERFYANLVSEEANVRQVASKVALGEADAAIVYATDVTPDIAGRVRSFAIPDRFNVVAAYPIAVLANAPNADLAEVFVQFLLSAEGKKCLARHGFSEPPQER